MKFIVGRKLGMTRIFDADGRHVAVTKIAALPTIISQVKTKDKDGYKAVQAKAMKNTSGNRTAKISEFKVENPGRYKVGDTVTLKQFKKDDLVTVQGTAKGKGFAGTIKRHGFHRGPETHGSNNVREPGSIGGGYPQRVILGRHMAGHMGTGTVTVKNLRVVDVDDEIIYLAGAVPGPAKSLVKIIGYGEKAEEEVDTAALEEQAAMEKLLEDQAAEKAEKNEAAAEEPTKDSE